MPGERRFPLAAGRAHSGDPQQDEIWRQIRQIIDYLANHPSSTIEIPGLGGEVLISDGAGGIDTVSPGAANTVLTSNGTRWSAQALPTGLVPAGLTGDVQIKLSSTALSNISPGNANTILYSNGTAWLAGVPASDHDVIVRRSGALAGVAPSNAGKVLYSNGTDWTSDAPGTDHDVIVRRSGVLTGVAPSNAGKVLYSNGTDWLSGAPSTDGYAIVQSGGALSGVAPSTSGNVLTSNGSAWVSQAPAAQAVGVWTSIYDIDFTSLGLSTASANGSFTIDGKTWTVANFSRANTMSVGGADGLRIKCTTTSSGMSPGSNTAPYFLSPAMSALLPTLPDDVRVGLRFSVYVKSYNRPTSGDTTYFMICDSTLDATRFEFEQWNNAATQSDYMRLLLSSATKVSQTIGSILTSPATHDCFQWEMGQLGIDIPNIIMTGIYSAGFPSKWYRRAQCSAAAGQFFNTSIKELADARILFGQGAAGAAGTSEVKFGRLKVEYYRYQ